MKRQRAIAVLLGIVILSTVMMSQLGIGTSTAVDVRVVGYITTSVVTETETSTSIHSYTTTSRSTTTTTTTTASTTTQTVVTTSTLRTSTTTTDTSTSWLTETHTFATSRTSTIVVLLTTTATTSLTQTLTSFHPIATLTSTNATYKTTTVFSPTVTMTSVETSLVPTSSTTTLVVTTTTTVTTASTIRYACFIASAAYGSELAPQVQLLREFRDCTVMSSFAGTQFMRAFNAFYYSFSPTLAEAVMANPTVASLARISISPLVASLRIASQTLGMLPLNPELATLLGGILIGSFIGAVCLMPLAVIATIAKRRLRHALRISSSRASMMT